MMHPPLPHFSVHTIPCPSPFLPAIRYRMGGGYELSNPKGNVPRRQLPSEKLPFPWRKGVCLRADASVGGEFDVDWLVSPGNGQLCLLRLSINVQMHAYAKTLKHWQTISFSLFNVCFQGSNYPEDYSLSVTSHWGKPFLLQMKFSQCIV